MEGLWLVLALGGIMALASFLAGSLLLSFSLSSRNMSRITSLGTGLLIGTALAVIIPEGMATLYSAAALSSKRSVHKSSFSKASEEGHAGKKGALGELANHGVGPQQQQNEQAGREEELAHFISRAVVGGVEELVKRAAKEEKGHTHQHANEGESSHAWIGVALISGFVLMYLIDALQKPSPSSRGEHIPLTQLDPEELPPAKPTPVQSSHSSSTTIGLVIHSFADGIALGASSADTQTESSLGLIVFIAILVHKAPAAFGLTSVLLKQGLSKRAARAHLLLFSLAAPVGALATWTLVTLLSGSGEAGVVTGNSTWWTGIALVFSGGTFLYVAMHAMQETGHSPSGDPAPKSRSGVLLTVIGMLLPLLTQIGHAHAHGH